MLTDDQLAYVERAIARGKREIAQDIRIGLVPPDITEFAKLHDFVDANEYGGLCDDSDEEGDRLFPRVTDYDGDVWCEAGNKVQAALNDWLKSAERLQPLLTELVEDALNAACASIQEKLGVDDGGAAAVFFGGGEQEQLIVGVLARYALYEIGLMGQLP